MVHISLVNTARLLQLHLHAFAYDEGFLPMNGEFHLPRFFKPALLLIITVVSKFHGFGLSNQ